MLIQDSVKNLICNGFEFTKSKNGYKNTPVQVLEDCGIIFLFKEELCRSPDLYRFADPLRCWEHRGGFCYSVISISLIPCMPLLLLELLYSDQEHLCKILLQKPRRK